MTTALLILAVIAFFAYGVQTITGFGAMVISVPLGAQFMPISELLLLLLPLSFAQCLTIAFRHRAAIDWALLLRWIIPVMGVGTAIGAAVAPSISGDHLRRALAVLILTLSAFELYSLHRQRPPRPILSPPTTALGLISAGLMHGIYATGGPLLVYTIGQRVSDKATFRATLTVVWLLLNGALVGYFLIAGRYQTSHPTEIAMLLPGVALAIVVGERLHDALNGRRFRQLTFSFLALAAIALFFR